MGSKKSTLTGLTPLWSLRKYFRGSTRLPGSRFSRRTFQSQTTQQWYPLSTIAHSQRTFIVLWSSSPKKLEYIYMMPGGNYNVKKKLKTGPIKHLH
jgi:hypothetical protein